MDTTRPSGLAELLAVSSQLLLFKAPVPAELMSEEGGGGVVVVVFGGVV